MMKESQGWIEVEALHSISRGEALRLADRRLGDPTLWPSPLVNYRLGSDFQSDWKEEVGHWLHTAGQCGFADALVERIVSRARRGTRSQGIDPNDKRHLELKQELAPAMVAHYLIGLGWSFDAWEPSGPRGIDVDLSLEPPGCPAVSIQVKAPDQPGRFEGHRVVDGGFDDRVIAAVEKAGKQLKGNPGANLVFVCANRDLSLASQPFCLVTHLVGSSVQTEYHVSIPLSRRGRFFDADWQDVAGVAALDFNRGVRLLYSCSVLTNPAAKHVAQADWFRRARVAVLQGQTFEWVRGEPTAEHFLPAGTVLEGWAGPLSARADANGTGDGSLD